MANTVINVSDTISPLLKTLSASMSDYRTPLKRCGFWMQRSFSKQFTARGKPTWQPLSPATIAKRRNHSDSPLLDTGRLRRSYISASANHIWELTKFLLNIGSNLRYAKLHQFGGRSPLNIGAGRWITIRVPARPLSIQPEDVRAFKSIFEDYIRHELRRRA